MLPESARKHSTATKVIATAADVRRLGPIPPMTFRLWAPRLVHVCQPSGRSDEHVAAPGSIARLAIMAHELIHSGVEGF